MYLWKVNVVCRSDRYDNDEREVIFLMGGLETITGRIEMLKEASYQYYYRKYLTEIIGDEGKESGGRPPTRASSKRVRRRPLSFLSVVNVTSEHMFCGACKGMTCDTSEPLKKKPLEPAKNQLPSRGITRSENAHGTSQITPSQVGREIQKHYFNSTESDATTFDS